MKSFLNLLCHALIWSTTQCLYRIFFPFILLFLHYLLLFIPPPPPLSCFLTSMCKLSSRLISFCSSSKELYPIPKHRCCSNRRRIDLRLDVDNDFGLLIMTLSTASVTNLMSWVLAGKITTDKGDAFLICQNMSFYTQFAPIYIRIFSSLVPTRGDFIYMESIDSLVQLLLTFLS